MPGPWELIIILVIVVMIFGAKRIPEIMGGIGKGIRSFKKSLEPDDPQEPLSTIPEKSQDKDEPK